MCHTHRCNTENSAAVPSLGNRCKASLAAQALLRHCGGALRAHVGAATGAAAAGLAAAGVEVGLSPVRAAHSPLRACNTLHTKL